MAPNTSLLISQNLLNFLLHLDDLSSTCGCKRNIQRTNYLLEGLAGWHYGFGEGLSSSVLTSYSSSVLLYLSHRSWDGLKLKGLMLHGGMVPIRERALQR